MKKLMTLMLILTMAAALFAFAPTIAAEEDVATSQDIADTYLDTFKLNEPIYDNVNYYIDIKSPSIFASFDKTLAVVQGDDILVKIDRHIETIKGGAKYDRDGNISTIKSITLDKYIDSTNNYHGYIYLTYINIDGSYITKIYKYNSFSVDTTGSYLTPIASFGEYMTSRGITNATPEIIANLDAAAADFCFVGDIMYILSKNEMTYIYKIYKDQISAVSFSKASQAILNGAKYFTANEKGDIFTYGYSDRESVLFKMTAGSEDLKNVLEYDNILDIVSANNKLYLLTSTKLIIRSVSDVNRTILEFPFDEGKECLSFNVSSITDSKGVSTNYISFALSENDNILTYKEVMENGKFSLEFYNHYGANCTCKEPHQGWLNSPTKIAVTNDESTAYVVDNNGNRLVAHVRGKNEFNYTQHFFNASSLNINKPISNIAVDKWNVLYIASENKIFQYKDNGEYDKKDELPFSRVGEFNGFDGAIIDIKVVSRAKSTIYVLTDKNSVYRFDDGFDDDATEPSKIATFNDKIISISPSFDNSRLYVASTNSVKSYKIDDIDINVPLTMLATDKAISNIAVDYNGNIFAASEDNTIKFFKRVEDNAYNLIASYTSPNRMKHMASFYIVPSSKGLYFTDSSLHTLEKCRNAKWGFKNESDKYIEGNDFDQELLYVAKTTEPTRIYDSPTNFEQYRTADKDEYFYVVAIDKNNKNMHMVVDKDSNFKFIKKDKLTKVNATTDCIYGSTLVPLRGSTDIYKYPFSALRSEPIATVTGTMLLIDNVAYENNTYVWQNPTTKWFKVSYLDEHNMQLEGYVMMRDISKASNVVAPSTKIHLRIKTKPGETVDMYDMPDIASGIKVKGIINGTLVRLMQDTFDEDSEFTLVELETKDGEKHVGYIKTANLQENTFTTLQIVAIVVTSITIVITILVVVLIVLYRKKRASGNNFRDKN